MPSALVAKLRKQPEVRDAEALAAWIGRYKKLRNAGVGNKKAIKLASKPGGMKEGGVKKKDRSTLGGTGEPERGTPNTKREAAMVKNLKKGDRVLARDGDDLGPAIVSGKTRDGKIKVQPLGRLGANSRERALDPFDISPDSRNGRTLSPSGSLNEGSTSKADREHRREQRNPTAAAKALKKKVAEDDDPFAEDYYDDPFADEDSGDLTPAEKRQQEKYEAQAMKGFEDAEKGKLYNIFMEMGGLKTRDDLREEYREVPNTYKRKDGMAGDEMAEYIGMYYPEFGIEAENDLLEFFAA